jgi:hypothetical protein
METATEEDHMSIRTSIGRVGVAALLIAALGVQAPARADFQACTKGDAQLNLNAGPTLIGALFFPQRGLAGNAYDAVTTCRYNLFTDQPVTFTADDWFVGQITWLVAYKQDGISRAEAIADIKLGTDRVWLAPVLPDGSFGPLVEQTLHYSAFKDTFRPFAEGNLVYQIRAFATQLPPGDYVSIWLTQYPGEPDFTNTVYITITP